MLKNNIIPELEQHSNFRTMIWQQDGASPHYGQAVREYLNNIFAQWIGRQGAVECPLGSPDLTPCDFSLCGIIKNRGYPQKPRDLDHLK